MTESPVVVLHISDSGSSSLDGLTRDQLHRLAETLRQAAKPYTKDAKVLTRFDVRVSELVVDLPAREVRVSGNGIRLSHTEFEVFTTLVRNPRVVIEREKFAVTGTGRSVDVHLSRVRTKLGAFGKSITTVRGTGYRFDPTPSVRVISEPVRLRTA